MRAVEWSELARRRYKEIAAYIALDDAAAARVVAKRLNTAAAALGRFNTGHPGRVLGTYEKYVSGTSHILFYAIQRRANAEYVYILDIVHTSRDWPKGEMPPR